MKTMLFILVFIFINSILMAEVVRISKVPEKLPINLPLESYSPMLEFDYSGLEQDNYTLKAWLLNPGSWYCASTALR